MKPPRPIDFRCPTCDARPGEQCRDGVTHIDRHGIVNRQEARKVARHELTIGEQQRVAEEQARIRQTLAGHKHRSTIR